MIDIQPSFRIDFARARQLNLPTNGFTRNSTAWRVNKMRKRESVRSHMPRFAYDPVTGASLGYLSERSAQNIVPRSQVDNSGYWTATGGVITNAQAPDSSGNVTMSKFAEDVATSGVARTAATATTNSISGQPYTISGEFRKGDAPFVYLIISGAHSSGPAVYVNTTTLALGTTGSGITGTGLIDQGNGVYRLWMAITADASVATYVFFGQTNVWLTQTHTRVIGMYTFFGEVQVEQNSQPTSIVTTTTAAVTRQPDALVIAGTDFSSWFNPLEGTLVARFKLPIVNKLDAWVCSLTENTSSNFLGIRGSYPGSPALASVNCASGVYDASMFSLNTVDNQSHAAAIRYRVNDYASAFNGVLSTDTAVAVPSGINRLYIGCNHVGTGQLCGTIDMIEYYPVGLSNSDLVELSTL